MSHISDDDDEEGDFRGCSHVQRQRIRDKLSNLPTIEGLLSEKDPHKYTEEQLLQAERLAADLCRRNPTSEGEMKAALKAQMKEFKSDNKKSLLLAGYRRLRESGRVAAHPFIEQHLLFKAPRSQSGVLVVTVFTSAYPEVNGKVQRFSCNWNCYYCPNEPGQPRSYLLNEPGVRRANRLRFDPVAQFVDRVNALVAIGHPADKVELLVLGGTWESYPIEYREAFMRDIFYAANTYRDPQPHRAPTTLLLEQRMNETAACRIIGVTLETRPDTINAAMLIQLRQFGCTRVQLGVQHTNDDILLTVNREATRDDTVRALRLLKDSCFKADIHLMPDLPGATPALDKAMFDDVLFSPDLQADQWKIYPCQTTPFTVIQEWFKQGKYRSYGMDALVDVLLYAKRNVHPWIRLNRVIRDIPGEYVLNGVECANLRQLLQQRLALSGERCKCIRCREVKTDPSMADKMKNARLFDRRYRANGAHEIFLSFETPDEQTIFGFLRLRLPSRATQETPFAELRGSALIRELHVYGTLVETAKHASGREAQHMGFGTRLLRHAEEVALAEGFDKIAVISGVGVRHYYAKRGYALKDPEHGAFMVKSLGATFSSRKSSFVKIVNIITGVFRRSRSFSLSSGCSWKDDAMLGAAMVHSPAAWRGALRHEYRWKYVIIVLSVVFCIVAFMLRPLVT